MAVKGRLIPVPNLDDRDWRAIKDEIIRAIPERTPEWTDHNLSDPGITLPDDQNVLINYTRYRVKADLLGVEKKDYFVLSMDAADDSPPDGYPDIPADGVSICQIRIQKKNGETGLDMTSLQDNDLMELRTQRGGLSAWQVNLVNGYAEVTLRSSTDTVITEVTVYDVARQLGQQVIKIQFT